MKRILPLLAVLSAFVFFCGCEHDGSSGGGNSSSLVGTWALSEGSTVSWYVIFESNGSWVIKDTPSAARNRVYGTYVSGNGSFSGPMENPGVGSGRISGTYSGNSMEFDFVEYWHTPHKTIHYKGSRQ